MRRRSRTMESEEGRAPPIKPVPPPHATTESPALPAKRTTATTSSVDRGHTTAAGFGPRSASKEPRWARKASV